MKQSRRHVAQHAVFLLQAPASGSIGHNEGDLVGGVGGLGLAFLVEHFFRVSVFNIVSGGAHIRQYRHE